MKTVLLVEDSDNVIWMYKEALGNLYNIVVAETYEEFLEKLPCNPDMVLTDFNFHGGNGNDVAVKAREVGIKHIVLQTSDCTSGPKEHLYDAVFWKGDYKDMFAYLKEKLV